MEWTIFFVCHLFLVFSAPAEQCWLFHGDSIALVLCYCFGALNSWLVVELSHCCSGQSSSFQHLIINRRSHCSWGILETFSSQPIHANSFNLCFQIPRQEGTIDLQIIAWPNLSSAGSPRPGGSQGTPHPFHETMFVCLEGFLQEGFVLGHVPAKPNKGTLTLSWLTEPFPGMTILKMESVPFSFHHPITSPFSFCGHGCRALSGARVISGGLFWGMVDWRHLLGYHGISSLHVGSWRNSELTVCGGFLWWILCFVVRGQTLMWSCTVFS